MHRILWAAMSLVLLIASPVFGVDLPREFLKHNCVGCHGPDVTEADLRLDQLQKPGADEQTQRQWALVADVVESREMPPGSEKKLPDDDIRSFTRSVSALLASAAQPVRGPRRLNRREYEYTLHDLLEIDTSLAEFLPEDSSIQGFDNVAGGLGISSILMERYLEAADVAFENTIRRIQPLPVETRVSVLMEDKNNVESVKKNKGGVVSQDGAFVDFTPGWPPARIDEAHPIDNGTYRCRITVWPIDPNDHRTLTVAVFAGPLFGPGKRRFLGMYDVTGTSREPRVIEITTFMHAGETLHVLPWIFPAHVTWRDKEESRPGVAIKSVEIRGPLDQSFPSQSQKRLFGSSSTISLEPGDPIYMRHRRGVRLHFVDSSKPEADAERIIRELVPHAFRRPVSAELTDQFVSLTLVRLNEGSTFEQAVRTGVTAVLCSPHFLLLNEPEELDSYAMASRLSYFLWSSMPDAELIELARNGRLADRDVLHAQVDRMIDDPKSERFVQSFVEQWLDLREIEFTTPDGKLYPEYDGLLLRSMLAETRGFVRHVLKNDLSVSNFVDSDFACLNQRMAEHYGIPGIRGHEQFRIFPIPADSIRGGILTHASVLKVTANGTTTSPVIRGAWVLDKVMGRPAPPPPPGVPAVEPDIRGAVSIRDQLSRHRDIESCARCHRRIDPPGFALEEFDVIGGHREVYRSLTKKGARIPKTTYYHGLPVESHGELLDGHKFTNFTEFREAIKRQEHMVVRSLATKLLVYGCGRPVRPADRSNVDQVVDAVARKENGLRSMIHAVVDSELFHRP